MINRSALLGFVFMLVAAAVAWAGPIKTSVPVDGLTVPNVCANPPDAVTLSGNLDVTVNLKIDRGGIASGKASFNAGGIKGVGLINNRYVGNGTGNFNFKVGPVPARVVGPGHFFLLQPGPDNDLKVGFLLHFTINGNGSVSNYSVEIKKAECGEFGL